MYGIHVKFNDEHIPNSPYMVNIAPDSGIARTVTVHALKDRGLAVILAYIQKKIDFNVLVF